MWARRRIGRGRCLVGAERGGEAIRIVGIVVCASRIGIRMRLFLLVSLFSFSDGLFDTWTLTDRMFL